MESTSRILKPAAMAILVYFAVYYLTGSVVSAIAIALIPLLLGWLAIFGSMGVIVTGITLVAALVWVATPLNVKHMFQRQMQAWSEIATDTAPESAAAKPQPAAKKN